MLMLFVTVFGLSWGFSTGYLLTATGCYGKSIELPSYPFSTATEPLYFVPSNRGPRRIVMDKGTPKDPRIIKFRAKFFLTNLTKDDDGSFTTSQNEMGFYRQFTLEISDCAEKIYKDYMDNLVYNIPSVAHFMAFTPELDSQHKPVILWNRTDLQSSDKRRGKIKSNIWRVSQLTQADNGYYIFRKNDSKLESIVLLTVKGNTLYYEQNAGQHLFIPYPTSGGPWTVVFKPGRINRPENMLKDGQVVWKDNRFSGRLEAQDDGLKIENLESKDSGSFEFRDPQGNLALIVNVEVNEKPNHAVVTYAAVSVGALLAGIICCCCCKKCCCKKSSAPQTEAALAGTYHDKTSGTATSPPVYYHNANPSTGPFCPAPANPSVYPHQPPYQPANIYPTQPGINVYPPQPGINMYPTQAGISVNPPSSGINVNPPQPSIDIHPPQPGINVNPLQPEVSLPTHQGSAAVPTFNVEFLSSEPDTRFELKGLNIPSAPPLSSEASSSDVYTSDKLNFL